MFRVVHLLFLLLLPLFTVPPSYDVLLVVFAWQ
jgi:hypothetical protein